MRKLIIAGNWKMNKTVSETKVFLKELSVQKLDFNKADIVVCPPFIDLTSAVEILRNSSIGVGAQNMHCADSGAFTGEVSPKMLRDAEVEYVIIGHSERRQYFAETDEFVNSKVKSALANKLKPIMCVGESLEQRESGATHETVRTQLLKGLEDIDAADAANIIIAYEPVWAIGTGRTASAADAQDVCAYLRKLLTELYGKETAEIIRIQYGGSVKPSNAEELLSQPDIDGALVGGASLKTADFVGIIVNA